jgi:hypothetical protein
MLLEIFWVVPRRHFLVHDQRFGITCLSHLQALRPRRRDKQVIPKRWSYTKNWRRVTTQKISSNITTTAEAFNYIVCFTNKMLRGFIKKQNFISGDLNWKKSLPQHCINTEIKIRNSITKLPIFVINDTCLRNSKTSLADPRYSAEHSFNTTGLSQRCCQTKNWRRLGGNSSKKSNEVKEMGGVMCKMLLNTKRESYKHRTATTSNHASALLHVFLSSYIIEHRCLVLLLPWSCWTVFFFLKARNIHIFPVLFSGSS